MTGSGRIPGPWLFALPGFVTVTFVFDMFDLGQTEPHSAGEDAVRFLVAGQTAPVDGGGGSMFAAGHAHQVFPVPCFLSALAQALGLSRSMVPFSESSVSVPAPIRRCTSKCFRTEDLVFREWSDRVRNRASGLASRTGPWVTILIAVRIV